MLFPQSHAWTQRQRWIIAAAVTLAIVALGIFVYSYERFYRGPSQSALLGTWQDTTSAMDSETYYRFKPDGTFDLLIGGMGELFVAATGKWYAGGSNIYLRFADETMEGQRPLIMHI